MMMTGKIEVSRDMGLSKTNEKLLIELVKNQDNLGAYVNSLYKELSNNEESKLNARFGKLRDEGFLQVRFGDNRAYIVILKPDAEDYVKDNGLLIEEFTKETLLDIIRNVGSNHGHIYPTIWGIKGGSESIEWRQLDEQEWEMRVGIVANIPEAKRIGREIVEAMEGHNYTVDNIDNDESRPRFEQTIRFTHESNLQVVDATPVILEFDFDKFFNDFTNSCLTMQSFGAINKKKSGEDVKTQAIRNSLQDKGYNADDQTQRGASATGILAGEVDLLINNDNMMPVTMIEALILESVTVAEIKSHIDKMTNYDTAGLPINILLVYTYIADFDAFISRYMERIITDIELRYPLSKLKDISTNEHSEFKVLTSTYKRSGYNRTLLHVFVNLPRR